MYSCTVHYKLKTYLAYNSFLKYEIIGRINFNIHTNVQESCRLPIRITTK